MKIDSDIVIARPPDAVWAVLGDLAGVTRWVPGVASARLEGDRRICVMEDGSEIHEEISGFSDEDRRYGYEQTLHPLGFRRSVGNLAVESQGNGVSRVVWTADVEFGDAAQERQLGPMLRQGYADALAQLKDVTEASLQPPHVPPKDPQPIALW